jgi:two-component system, response regulator YesN
MPYKVFLVEDEIVTREGIRDNVDWNAFDFEFCGDAPDGEMALPSLQLIKPDLLITDIRMPFMDGLELSQIVRDRMPGTKIIILSGHDEFEYAQRAIKLGVRAYLLKPISVQDIHQVLQEVASELDAEQSEQEALQKLREQVEENRAVLRERFLLRLVTGAASSAEVIEKSAALGIDLIARCYLVAVIRLAGLEPAASSEQPLDFPRFQRAEQLVYSLIGTDPDVFLLRKDVDELVLVLKGPSPGQVCERRDQILQRAASELAPLDCRLIAASGTPQQRITDISHSFSEAAQDLQDADARNVTYVFDKAHFVNAGNSEVGDYLRVGAIEEFDTLFDSLVAPLGARALRSPSVRMSFFADVVLAASRVVDELGGDVEQVIPELDHFDGVLAGIENLEHLRARTRTVLAGALAFRNSQVLRQYLGLVTQAQGYILAHYLDPELSLGEVAAQVNLSANHFSAVFSQEIGQTFKEYLTEVRLKRAKELLRTTTLKSFEIADQIGYNDPHYFSQVFRKHTGLTPMEFRANVRAERAP